MDFLTKHDHYFLTLARHVASASKDPSTKVGCVIVGGTSDREVRATGYNGFPRGIADTDERLNDRETKYRLVVHAEENAVLQAARHGIALKGATAYVTMCPCIRCATSLIQAGITRVVYDGSLEIPERWAQDCQESIALLREARVRVES